MTDMTDRVVLVTGAARGLGRATALAFAQADASLFIVDVNAPGLEATQKDIIALGRPCVAHSVDISSRAACFDAVKRALAEFGGLDVLCNVAGILRFHHTVEVTEADWTKLFAINVSAPFYFCQAAIPHLLARKGNIVNVASCGSYFGMAYAVPYATTKAAVLHMTKSLAMEFMKQPIRINAVAPGAMETGITEDASVPPDADLALMGRYQPLRPVSQPEETANLIVYVASDQGKSIHGACLSIDDGITAG